jgi:chromosome segregation and condensation protein ScpB
VELSVDLEIKMQIGEQVQVRRLRDKVSDEVVSKLGAVGTIRDFKMVDGSGVGYLVEFGDKFATWFFQDELEQV